MAFKNEDVLPLEQEETTEFWNKARVTLRKGYSKYDVWTIDRERDMVLVSRARGHSMEDKDKETWSFLDRKGGYFIGTERLSESEISPEEIAITRSFYYMTGGGDITPDAETITGIKEALQEYSRSYMFNLEHYKRCRLTLIDARTKKEI